MKSVRSALTFLVVCLLILVTGCSSVAPTSTQTTEETEAANVSAATDQATVQATDSTEPVKLTILTHYGEESLSKPLQAMISEYEALNPNVTIELQAVTFDQLLTKISTARASGTSPDIYHFYNLWLPNFVKGDMLSVPTQDVTDDINANYAPGSIGAVSFNDQIWGYPTEVDVYQLVYDKEVFKDAGLQPPTTFQELEDDACKLVQTDSNGTITRSGMAIMPNWDSGVVHPFLSLLWSAGGDYVNSDFSKSAFNSDLGLKTLKLYTDLISKKCIDTGIGTYSDFTNGKAAMVIMANWFRADLQSSFPNGYENVGVVPIPTDGGAKSVALQYNWLWGVDKNSKNSVEAWKFLKWLNSASEDGKASPMGDFLTSSLGVIPSRISDQNALSDRLGDDFMKAFVDATATSRPEPIFSGAQEVKTAFQTHIEAAWFNKETPEEALKAAADEVDKILAENK